MSDEQREAAQEKYLGRAMWNNPEAVAETFNAGWDAAMAAKAEPVPTAARMFVGSRQSGKTQKLIESLLAQANEQGIHVEIAEPVQIDRDPGAHGGPIPSYGMLDVWAALFGTSHPEFDEFYAKHGYAETWAWLMSEIRSRSALAAQPVQIDRDSLILAVRDIINDGRGTELHISGPDAARIADAAIAHLDAEPVTGSRQQVVLYEVYESDGEPWLFTSDKASALKALTRAADAGDGGDSYMVERAWSPRTEI